MILQGRSQLSGCHWRAGALYGPDGGAMVTLSMPGGEYELTPREARLLADRLENRADLADGGDDQL